MNTSAPGAPVEWPQHQDFAQAVRDILETFHREQEITSDIITEAIRAIVRAYGPRMAAERRKQAQLNREILTLVGRDTVKDELLNQTRKALHLLQEESLRSHVSLAHRGELYAALHRTIERARRDERVSVSVDALQDIIKLPLHTLPAAVPVPLGLAADHTSYRAGRFRDSANESVTWAFLGWSVVLYAMLDTAQIEPVFLVDGTPAIQSALLARGYALVELV